MSTSSAMAKHKRHFEEIGDNLFPWRRQNREDFYFFYKE
jgi:hypothetical protein